MVTGRGVAPFTDERAEGQRGERGHVSSHVAAAPWQSVLEPMPAEPKLTLLTRKEESQPCSSQCGCRTSSTSVTWELVKWQRGAPPRTGETLGGLRASPFAGFTIFPVQA